MTDRIPIEATKDCPLAGALAARLREDRRDLVERWLERIVDRVSIDPGRVFPTEDLLDHVPLLIDGIADYLEDPAAEVSVDIPVVAKAMELGALRHEQGFDAYQILKEYEILGGILFDHLAHAVDEMSEPCEKSELLVCGHRLFRAITIIQQTTTTHFLRLGEEAVTEREERLRSFNRTVSHEVKNRIGAALGASEMLMEIDNMSPGERERFAGIVSRNLQSLSSTVQDLLVLSQMEATSADSAPHRNVRLPEAAKEASRQIREAAQAAGVEVRIADDLPDIEVDAAAVELCLMNLVSNAIKYADAGKTDRFAAISASVEALPDGGEELVVRVSDNGLGVPAGARENLFERFFRAHDKSVTGVEGTGLGLSIVRETAESAGGRAWAEFREDGGGSVFAFSIPVRAEPSPKQSPRDIS